MYVIFYLLSMLVVVFSCFRVTCAALQAAVALHVVSHNGDQSSRPLSDHVFLLFSSLSDPAYPLVHTCCCHGLACSEL